MAREEQEGGTAHAQAQAPGEAADADRFIAEQTMGTIREIVASNDKELMPPPQSVSSKKGVIASPGLGLKDTIQEYLASPKSAPSMSPSPSPYSAAKKEERGENANSGGDGEGEEDEELDLTGIDDSEIDTYIMTEREKRTRSWT